MIVYDIWDIVVVPFPFVEIAVQKSRPVLVLSNHKFNNSNSQFMGAMITTAKKSKWPGDTIISDLQSTGLRTESLIRLKLFTIPGALQPRKIGTLCPTDIEAFKANWKDNLF